MQIICQKHYLAQYLVSTAQIWYAIKQIKQ